MKTFLWCVLLFFCFNKTYSQFDTLCIPPHFIFVVNSDKWFKSELLHVECNKLFGQTFYYNANYNIVITIATKKNVFFSENDSANANTFFEKLKKANEQNKNVKVLNYGQSDRAVIYTGIESNFIPDFLIKKEYLCNNNQATTINHFFVSDKKSLLYKKKVFQKVAFLNRTEKYYTLLNLTCTLKDKKEASILFQQFLENVFAVSDVEFEQRFKVVKVKER